MKTLRENQFLYAILFVGVLWFLYMIHSILLAVFVSYIIAAALRPLIEFLARKRIPKPLGVLLAYSIIITGSILLIIPLIPFFVSQLTSFFLVLPSYVERVLQVFHGNVEIEQMQSFFFGQINLLGQNAFNVTTAIFSGFFTGIMILFISFYLLIDHERITTHIVSHFPTSMQSKLHEAFTKAEQQLGAWVRGQLLLSLFIGLVTYIVLSLLNFSYALPLALLAGILELVPTIGPILSAIPALLIAVTISPQMTIIILAFSLSIQALENNFLVPVVMQRAVGLHPLAVVLAIAIGANLMGIIGALLAVPLLSVFYTFYVIMRTK